MQLKPVRNTQVYNYNPPACKCYVTQACTCTIEVFSNTSTRLNLYFGWYKTYS